MRIVLLLMLAATACLGAAPSTTTAPAMEERCQALVERWRPRLQADRLAYLISPPFVLAGDSNVARLRRFDALTVREAADALQHEFFATRPSRPILIFLFESDESYRRLARKWFGDTDVSPYGYFRTRDNVMMMNVATGTGTLVHELTHALMKPDFPDVPDWVNEGMGSLFEQCTLAGGKIRGLPNWRLAALQRAIKNDKLRPIEDMIKDRHFYGEHVGLNYAQARYLMLYLQEHDQLAAFYKRLRADHADDPTGLAAFKQSIAPQMLDEFENDWWAWVLKLQFP
jgi:hypothetical protein